MQVKKQVNQPFSLPARVERGIAIKKIKPPGLFMNRNDLNFMFFLTYCPAEAHPLRGIVYVTRVQLDFETCSRNNKTRTPPVTVPRTAPITVIPHKASELRTPHGNALVTVTLNTHPTVLANTHQPALETCLRRKSHWSVPVKAPPSAMIHIQLKNLPRFLNDSDQPSNPSNCIPAHTKTFVNIHHLATDKR